MKLCPVRIGCCLNLQYYFQYYFQPPISGRLHTFFASFAGGRVNTLHVAVTLCGMTCIHASVSRSPRGHGLVASDKRHCRQWMSSLFCGFLPNPFIHDLFLWRTSQEFVKTDLYPLPLTSVRYAICSTGWGSIIGRCFGACQRSSCAEESTTAIKKTSHLIHEMSMNLVVRTSFHWQKKMY